MYVGVWVSVHFGGGGGGGAMEGGAPTRASGGKTTLSPLALPPTHLPSPTPWEGGGPGGRELLMYMTITVSVTCDFKPFVFLVRILKKDIFMVIVAGLFYYIFM